MPIKLPTPRDFRKEPHLALGIVKVSGITHVSGRVESGLAAYLTNLLERNPT